MSDMRAALVATLLCDQRMQAMKRTIEARATVDDAEKFSRLLQLAFQYAAIVGMKAALDKVAKP